MFLPWFRRTMKEELIAGINSGTVLFIAIRYGEPGKYRFQEPESSAGFGSKTPFTAILHRNTWCSIFFISLKLF